MDCKSKERGSLQRHVFPTTCLHQRSSNKYFVITLTPAVTPTQCKRMQGAAPQQKQRNVLTVRCADCEVWQGFGAICWCFLSLRSARVIHASCSCVHMLATDLTRAVGSICLLLTCLELGIVLLKELSFFRAKNATMQS